MAGETKKLPATAFLGHIVNVDTYLDMGRTTPLDPFSQDEEIEKKFLNFVGKVIDVDAIYVTLGYIDDNDDIVPLVAIQHRDIRLISTQPLEPVMEEDLPGDLEDFDDSKLN